MSAASALRVLWRARRLVVVGAVVGLILGALLVYEVGPGFPPSLERRGHSIGVASAQVLVDSRSSQSVDLGEEPVLIDIPGLIARARLLANLIATSPLKDEIARRAGIDPRTFLATAPSVGFDSPKPRGTEIGPVSAMTVTFNEALPIVTINAEAATEAKAARISSAAASAMAGYLASLTARDRVRETQQLVVKPLGAADSATVHRGPRRLTVLVALCFVLGLWCIAVVVVTRMRRLRAPADCIADAFPGGVGLVPVPAGERLPRSQPPPVAALEHPERPAPPRRGVSA